MIRRRFNISKNQFANTIINYSTTDMQLIGLQSNSISLFGALLKSHYYGEIKFYNNVTKIGDRAFYGCSSLSSITIPDSVKTIGEYAFYDCNSLTSITIPDGVTSIENYAFAMCNSLTSVTIPDSVTTIGEYAFRNCESLKEFKGKFAADGGRCLIVDSVLNAFALGCGATQYTIPDSVTTIGKSAFWGCSSLTSVTIPYSVKTIGEYAFYDCKSLKSVTIGNSVMTIEYAAFYSCDSLTSVTIPDSVNTIRGTAFAYCYSLTSVTIGDRVTTIGESVFYGCNSLKTVYCKATIPPTLGGTYVFDYNSNGRKIYVPYQSLDAYKTATNWSEYADDIVGYDFENNKVYYPDSTTFEFPLYINVTDVNYEDDYTIEYSKSNSIISELDQWCQNKHTAGVDIIDNPNIYINGNRITVMEYDTGSWLFYWENMEDNWYGTLESSIIYIGMNK